MFKSLSLSSRSSYRGRIFPFGFEAVGLKWQDLVSSSTCLRVVVDVECLIVIGCLTARFGVSGYKFWKRAGEIGQFGLERAHQATISNYFGFIN